MLVLSFQVDITAEEFTEQFDMSEWRLGDDLVFTKVVAGFVDLGNIDFGMGFEMLLCVGMWVPEDVVDFFSVAKR